MQTAKKDFDYLGLVYQERLLAQIIVDINFAKNILPILKTDYFSNEELKIISNELINTFKLNEVVLDFDSILIRLKEKYQTESKQDIIEAYINKLRGCSRNDWENIQSKALNFCKSQEFIRVINDVNNQVKKSGNVEDVLDYESTINNILNIGKTGSINRTTFSNIEALLTTKFRQTIPTGIVKLDEVMGGGLGRKELGILIAPLGTGKAQPLFSKVLTPNGWVTMGDIKIDDEVITQSGKSTKVVGVFPQGVRPTYKVTFSDGASTICDEEHLWGFYDVDKEYHVLTTREIFKKLQNFEFMEIPTLVGQNHENRIFEHIESFGEYECQCIMVEDESHLYVTDDYIVTHNTTLSTIFCNTAYTMGYNVLQVCFEDHEEDIQRKHLARWSGIEIKDLHKNSSEVTRVALEKTSNNNGNLFIVKLSSIDTTMGTIKNYIKDLKNQGYPIDMMVIDYIDCVQPTRSSGDTNKDEALIMREYENLISEFNIAAWAMTQGNRSSISAEVVQVDQVGGSIKKAQIGHFIMTLSRPQEMRLENKAVIAILKSRFGRDGIVFKNCDFNNGNLQVTINDEQSKENMPPDVGLTLDNNQRLQNLVKTYSDLRGE